MIMQGAALREPFSVALPAKARDLHTIFCCGPQNSISAAPHRFRREMLTPISITPG
jgi:hypothetical protein